MWKGLEKRAVCQFGSSAAFRRTRVWILLLRALRPSQRNNYPDLTWYSIVIGLAEPSKIADGIRRPHILEIKGAKHCLVILL